MKSIIKIIITIALVAISITACSEGKESSEALEIEGAESNNVVVSQEQFNSSNMELGKVTDQVFSKNISATGMIDVPPQYKASVSAYYGGNVKDVLLLVGQTVKKGGLLFTLQSPEYIRMQKDYLVAKSELKYLSAEYERQKTLSNENISSQKNYLKAESDYYVMLTKYEALRKELYLIDIDPNELDENSISSVIGITSPISGNITEVNITKGEYLSPSEVAISIVNTEHLHLELNVFEKDILDIKVGQKIRFSLPDSREKVYEAEVFVVGKSINENDRSINIHGHLLDESQESNFLPGMYVDSQILTNDKVYKALHSNAVVNVDESYYVLVKRSNDSEKYIFEKREIKVGESVDGYTRILNTDDFGASDEILVNGAFNLIN